MDSLEMKVDGKKTKKKLFNCRLEENEDEDDECNKENMQIDQENGIHIGNVCNDGTIQPHCHITIKCTREIAGFNGLSDAFKRLDFRYG